MRYTRWQWFNSRTSWIENGKVDFEVYVLVSSSTWSSQSEWDLLAPRSLLLPPTEGFWGLGQRSGLRLWSARKSFPPFRILYTGRLVFYFWNVGSILFLLMCHVVDVLLTTATTTAVHMDSQFTESGLWILEEKRRPEAVIDRWVYRSRQPNWRTQNCGCQSRRSRNHVRYLNSTNTDAYSSDFLCKY